MSVRTWSTPARALRAPRPLARIAVGVGALGVVVATGAITPLHAATTNATLNVSCQFMNQTQNATVPLTVTVPDKPAAGQPVTVTMAAAQAVSAQTVNLIKLAGVATIDITATMDAVYAGGATGPAQFSMPMKTFTPPANGAWNVAVEQPLQFTMAMPGQGSVGLGNMTAQITPRKADGQPTQQGTLTATCTPAAGGVNMLASVTAA